MNEDMKIGAILALQGVKEELMTVRAELKRKGHDNRRGFTTIEAYIDDSIKELKWKEMQNKENKGKRGTHIQFKVLL